MDPGCTFCSLTNTRPVCKESFIHLFYYCDTTNKIIAEFFQQYFTIELPDKNMFFSGNISTKEDENLSLQLVLDVLWYNIWTIGHVNLKKKIPVISSLFSKINDTMGTIYEVSSKIKSKANS